MDAQDRKIHQLAQLVTEGDFGQVRRLATRHLMAATDAAHQTVLMLVASAADSPMQAEKCILYLFALGADPAASDGAGDTAAHVAVRAGNLRLLALLPSDSKWLQNKWGATPLMEAARAGSMRCAKHLLHLLRQKAFNECESLENSKRRQFLMQTNSQGQTAQDLAKLGGHSKLASLIKREIRLVVDKTGGISGLTALEEEDREKLLQLITAGDLAGLRLLATPENCDLPDVWGRTVLWKATELSTSGDVTVLEHLLKLADRTCTNVNSVSCLHWAASKGKSAAAAVLLTAGASANSRDYSASTPLMWAASSTATGSTVASVGQALLAAGSDWCLTDSEGRTALDLARRKESNGLAELLGGFEGKVYFDEPQDLLRQTAEPMQSSANRQEVDAPPYSRAALPRVSQRRQQYLPQRTSSPVAAANRPDEDFYAVTEPQGFCVIININQYSDGEERRGSKRDVEMVCRLFAKLHFFIILREDLTTEEIVRLLDEVKSSEALAGHSSFVCFLMAHGNDEDCIYDVNGQTCPIQTLRAKFESPSCPKLAGKPKVFFVQACRGSGHDEGDRWAVDARPMAELPLRPQLEVTNCPARADFLVCYATTEGHSAYRRTESGSLYIRTLCEVIERSYKEEDLVHIMTRVNRHMKLSPVQDGNRTYYCVTQMVLQLSHKISLDPSRAFHPSG